MPILIPSLEGEDVKEAHVYNGCEHTLLVTRDGKLYSFGYNYRGQLGLGSNVSEPIPRAVKGLLARKVVLAACSYHHSIVVCADGAVLSFGRNDCGQLVRLHTSMATMSTLFLPQKHFIRHNKLN